jgi:hypothetical protein
MKIPPVEADLFHSDRERERQRDGHRHAEPNIFLLQFAKAPEVYNISKEAAIFFPIQQ